MVAYIYYQLITDQYLYRHFPYLVFTCIESHLDIYKVHTYCRKLAESDDIKLSFAIATGDSNDGIRLVDYVAKSLGSNKRHRLEELDCMHCIRIRKDERLLRKLFD